MDHTERELNNINQVTIVASPTKSKLELFTKCQDS